MQVFAKWSYLESYLDGRTAFRLALQDAVEQGGSKDSDAVSVQQLDAAALMWHKVQQPICIAIYARTPAVIPKTIPMVSV